MHRVLRNTGEVLTALKESGAESNTIVLFLGDHGACFTLVCIRVQLRRRCIMLGGYDGYLHR